MTLTTEWVILDTNVWIFGLRNQPERPACTRVLQRLSRLLVHVPRQILLELRANLYPDEMDAFFRLLNHYPDQVEISWERADQKLIEKYLQLGCKAGDAAVAAHVESLNVPLLVSENRDFLSEITGLPFQVFSAEEALRKIE